MTTPRILIVKGANPLTNRINQLKRKKNSKDKITDKEQKRLKLNTKSKSRILQKEKIKSQSKTRKETLA